MTLKILTIMLIRRLEVLKLIVYSYMESNKFNADSSDSNEIEKQRQEKKVKNTGYY